MRKTKIEWCDCTWNPIVGCKHDCTYCYARKQANRFAGDIRLNISDKHCIRLDNGLYKVVAPIISSNGRKLPFPCGFSPTLMEYRLTEPQDWTASKNIFVGSMADVFGAWVPDEWITNIFDSCSFYDHHNYLFLTKNRNRYEELYHKGLLLCMANMWYGCSFTKPTEVKTLVNSNYNTFVSIEPILGDVGFELSIRNEKVADWIIIGAETGNRSGKVKPSIEWITHITDYCDKFGIPVFMKNSLINIVGEEHMRQEFPEGLKKSKPFSDKQEAVLLANCSKCGNTLQKSKMHAISTKKGKHGKVNTIGFVCEDCYPDFLKGFN